MAKPMKSRLPRLARPFSTYNNSHTLFDVLKHFLLIKSLKAKKDFSRMKSYALNVRLLNPLKSSFLSCPQRSFNGGTFSGRLSACVACSINWESTSFKVLSEKVSIVHQPKMGLGTEIKKVLL